MAEPTDQQSAIFRTLRGMSRMSDDIRVEPIKGAPGNSIRSVLVFDDNRKTTISFLLQWRPPNKRTKRKGYYIGYVTDHKDEKVTDAVIKLYDEDDAILFAAAFFNLKKLRARKWNDI